MILICEKNLLQKEETKISRWPGEKFADTATSAGVRAGA
jgi:hypothetical protein